MSPLAPVVAIGSGVVSFLAPCTLPLLPAYVGVLSGGTASAARLVRGAAAYVLGFTAVFVALGAGVGGLAGQVRSAGGPVQRVGGVVVVALALLMLAESRTGWLSRLGGSGQARLRSTTSPLLLGVVFATAFTPCVGPFLGGVLTLAASEGGAGTGALLLGLYALGLGLPFVTAALLVAASPGATRRLARWSGRVQLVGGTLLLALGVLLLSGRYTALTGWLAQLSPTV